MEGILGIFAKATVGTIGLAVTMVSASAATTVRIEDFVASNNTPIAAGFGNAGPVSLNWDPFNSAATRLLKWNGAYSGRDGAWCNSGINCAVDLRVSGSNSVTLSGFRFGGWPNADRTVTFSVIDLANNQTISAGTPFVSGTLGYVQQISFTSSQGFRIQFGPDGFNGGINDIQFNSAPLSAVPEPQSWALLIGGFALVGSSLRVRRRRVSFT
jgi:hypothetical protein